MQALRQNDPPLQRSAEALRQKAVLYEKLKKKELTDEERVGIEVVLVDCQVQELLFVLVCVHTDNSVILSLVPTSLLHVSFLPFAVLSSRNSIW